MDDEGEPRRDLKVIVEEMWRYDPEVSDGKGGYIKAGASKPDIALSEDIHMGDDAFLEEPALGNGRTSVKILVDLQGTNRISVGTLRAKLELKRGPTPVKLHFVAGEKEVVVDTGPDRRIVFSPEFREILLAIPGVKDVALVGS